ncbi:unnamed protein product [Darwinula stevensoni]|uniref:DUF4789 domain-containing protein n=1 Tax=Darwinula stevensoni TaxID=69355 RepID=A0A7R8ZZK1_9CRUS|nr:unnamed protein product [Darwinula stevensoni]CAG0882672.1 unnamed protein product [Darwinula stevensoni]
MLFWLLFVLTKVERGSSHPPCEKSYQAQWPSNGLCYTEFTQGPCPPGREISYNVFIGSGECTCVRGFLEYPQNGQCYEEFGQGPCEPGLIFVTDPQGNGTCDCRPSLKFYYHRDTRKCFPLYSRGPCELGQHLVFDYARGEPSCRCKDNHIPWSDGNCYELNTRGPCREQCESGVECLLRDLDTRTTDCQCVSQYESDGRCFQAFSQGYCPLGQWLVPSQNHSTSSLQCQVKRECKKFDNWFHDPQTKTCYRQYSQGPCPKGKLFYLDRVSGEIKCGCESTWKPYYWPGDGGCYEPKSEGPCPRGKYFHYDVGNGRTECRCFHNHVPDRKFPVCHEEFTRADCPLGLLVRAHPRTGEAVCDCSKDMIGHFWAADGRCYEHFTRGPCEKGQMFRLGWGLDSPICMFWPPSFT